MRQKAVAVIGALVIVLVAGYAGMRALAPGSEPDLPEGLEEETERPIVERAVALSRIRIQTSTNFLGHRIYSIHGNVKNTSDRPLRLVEVLMTFVDAQDKPVQEGVHQVFEPKFKPLEPGTEFEFSVAFENLPKDWNYRIPHARVSRIAF
jgi:hypothetical protein